MHIVCVRDYIRTHNTYMWMHVIIYIYVYIYIKVCVFVYIYTPPRIDAYRLTCSRPGCSARRARMFG